MNKLTIEDYNNDFIYKPRWMMQQIGLKSSSETDVFAIVFNFSKNGQGVFSGSREYIADLINVDVKTVGRILNSLVERQYLIKGYSKTKNGDSGNIKHPVYAANIEYVKELRNKYYEVNKKEMDSKFIMFSEHINDNKNIFECNENYIAIAENNTTPNRTICPDNRTIYPQNRTFCPQNRTFYPDNRTECPTIIYNNINNNIKDNVDIIEHDKPIKDSDTEKSIEDKPLVQKELFVSDSEKRIVVPPKKKQVKKPDFPPTVEEIDAYLREKDLPLDAFKIWQWYDTTNWCDKSGRKISNWKIKILNSWMSPKYHPELVNKHYNDVGHTKSEVNAPKNEVSLPTAEENDASSKQVHEISEAGKKIQAMLRASLKNNS